MAFLVKHWPIICWEFVTMGAGLWLPSAAGPIFIGLGIVGFVVWILWKPWTRGPLKIVYDSRDGRFVEGGVIRVGLMNNTSDGKSLTNVSLRVQSGGFASNSLNSELEPVIFRCDYLDSGHLEPIPLRFLADLQSKRRFTLEALARDVRNDTATFEYDPQGSPRLRRIT